MLQPISKKFSAQSLFQKCSPITVSCSSLMVKYSRRPYNAGKIYFLKNFISYFKRLVILNLPGSRPVQDDKDVNLQTYADNTTIGLTSSGSTCITGFGLSIGFIPKRKRVRAYGRTNKW